ncbi:MAG TPA: glycosyltransferase family 2 protein [Bacillota bacterium]|nr:glycosyltransferase family 2 protein [Bacillota bacterium]
MITISLCMIVKNEEEVIGRCLESIADLVDEIIIMDTGSDDGTKAVVKKYTEKIFDFQWIDDFAAARNAAFEKAGMDYILWLDADDVLEEEDRKKFAALKELLDPAVDSVTMEYHIGFDEYGNVAFRGRRNRLVKRARKFRWIGAVHEYLEVSGNIYHSDVAVTHKSLRHDSDRNLKIYEKRLSRGETFSPRDLYYYANELMDHRQYERAISIYEQFLATGKGWVEDNISSCGKLADCFHHLNDQKRELESVLRSFGYDCPRAEFCCRLGYHFLQQKDIPSAIFWYKVAAALKPPKVQLGFYNSTFSTWLPYLQLCVCYSRIGEYKLAYLHNEAALQYRPDDQRMLQNRKYLKKLLGEDEETGEKDTKTDEG